MERGSKMEVTENKILLQDINYIYSNLNNKKYFKNKSILITGSNGFIELISRIFL